MKSWMKVLLGAGLAAVLLVGAAFAAGRGRGPAFMKQMIERRISDAEDYIDATPEQREVIAAAKDRIVAKVQEHAKANRMDRGKIIGMLTGDNVDEKGLLQLIDDKAASTKQLVQQVMPDVRDIHHALTTDQRSKLADYAKQQQGRWHHDPQGQ